MSDPTSFEKPCAWSIAIAVVSYNCADAVRSCVESLAKLEYASFSIHILENAGGEAYTQLREALTGIVAFQDARPSHTISVLDVTTGVVIGRDVQIAVYKSSRNTGFAGGVNSIIRSIEHCEWNAVWILNPDTRVRPDALATLVEYSKTTGASVVGSRLIHEGTGHIQMYGGHWRAWMARGLALGLGLPADLEPDIASVERQLDFVSGAAMLVSRVYIEQVGLMDEGYFLYFEEVDWCLRRRAFRLGYCHASIVYHDHGVTTGASMSRRTMSPLTIYLDERNKLILVRKFYPRRFPATALICLLLTSQYLMSGAVRSFFFALRGWWAGVRGQQGAPKVFVKA
jgi:N-acetylglucosaminyl-diphospho-decaprenol L-rhamnosyltransferase